MNNALLQDVGYVLHRRLYRESSLILDVFTRHHGCISLLAKGARRPKSPWRGTTQCFTSLLFGWRGSSGLATMTMVEVKGAALSIAGKCLIVGLYVNELLIRLLGKHIVYQNVFDQYNSLLMNLSEDNNFCAHLRCFEYALLQAVGYGFSLSVDATTDNAILADQWYLFKPGHGFSIINKSMKKKENNSCIFLGQSLLALHSKNLASDRSLFDAKRLLRLCLSFHLGERQLKTRELWIN